MTARLEHKIIVVVTRRTAPLRTPPIPAKHERNVHMDIRPLHDRVLVRRVQEGESRVGSIIIPDSAKEKPQEGEVIAVGSGKLLESGERAALDVKAGDRILFGKYSGSDIKIEGEEYMVMREDEILGILG